jgi:cysteine synthase
MRCLGRSKLSQKELNTAMQIFDSISGVVGNTPLIRMSRIEPDLKHNLLAKCEFLNPGGSVKDRIAFRMVQSAEENGRLKPGQTMVSLWLLN